MNKLIFLLSCLLFSLMECTGQNFQRTCNKIRLEGNTLNASCRMSNGRFMPTSANLDSCVSNNDGNLTRGNNFSQTCRNCSIRNSVQYLACLCKKRDGSEINSTIRIADFVTNTDGSLRC